MKKRFLNINLLLLALALACLIYYDHARGLWLKGVTSAWFVLLGAVNLIPIYRSGRRKRGFAWMLLLGLVFAMLADIFLGIHFIAGTLLFAAGHVCYLLAFCILQKPGRQDLLPMAAACAFALLAVFATPFIEISDPSLVGLLGGYAVIISVMLGKAVGNCRSRTTRTRRLLLLGSAMFWFSDLMLALSMFGSGGRIAGQLCMYTYWPGQYLMGHTLYHFAFDPEE